MLRYFSRLTTFNFCNSTMAQAMVDDLIKSKKVVIFSKTGCPYCDTAKKIFSKYVGQTVPSDEYTVIEINKRDDCAQIQGYLQKLTGARTVPRVFINQKCIGGGDETESFHRAGKLTQMLS